MGCTAWIAPPLAHNTCRLQLWWGQRIAQLRAITLTEVHKYIEIAARDCKQHDDLAQLVEAQLMDPFTGLIGGEKPQAPPA